MSQAISDPSMLKLAPAGCASRAGLVAEAEPRSSAAL